MQELVKERKIDHILHFTRLENLDSILKHGLKSRKYLESNKHPAVFNDDYRIDGFKEAICCSICHPNYKMFFPLRMANITKEWVVIGIKRKVIWKKDCAFCVENAASNAVTSVPILDRKGLTALKKIFEEIPGKPSRKQLGIPDSCPTNPQAEILVFDDIEPENIIGVAFQNAVRAKEYEKKYDGLIFIHGTPYFSARVDYTHW